MRRLHRITTAVAPDLVALQGVGPDVASTLLVTAGDNPHRLERDASFAVLCGTSPPPASSGKKQNRHRLNRGGDRQANAALWRIAIVRLSHDPRTREYGTAGSPAADPRRAIGSGCLTCSGFCTT